MDTTATGVIVPYGQMLIEAAPYLATGVVAIAVGGLAWVLHRYFPAYEGLARTAQVDQLLTKAVEYAFNAVPGAVQGKSATVDTGYPILNTALQYAIEHRQSWLFDWAGDAAALAQKLWARIPLEPDVPQPDFHAVALDVTAQVAAQGK